MFKTCELKDIEAEDIEDVLVVIEESLSIKFQNAELMNIVTFGQLTDHITNKIKLEQRDDCTSQQAFYKLREAVLSVSPIDLKTVSPHTPLADLFPRKNRRNTIKQLDRQLGFNLDLVGPADWVVITLLLLLLVSIIGLFFIWKAALILLVTVIAGFNIAYKFGNNLYLQTVGEVAEKMTREHYLTSRRNSQTFNRKEVEKVLVGCFVDYLGLDEAVLTRDARFG